jgi:hypothetical protein
MRVELRYEQPEPVEWTIEGDSKVSILSEFATTGDFISFAGLRQRTLFVVKSPTRQTIGEYLEGICWYLQTFLTLGTGQPQSITYLRATASSVEAEGRASPVHVDVLFGQEPVRAPSAATPREALFSRTDLGDRLEVSLNRWISRGKALRPVYSLYFGTFFNQAMYVEHQFLNMMQAVESYHRLVLGGEYLEATAFEEVRRALMGAIPATGNSAFESALKERLRYHNEWSLRRRLKGLLDQHGSLAAPVLPGPESFVGDVVDTRNYLTHYDPDLRAVAKIGLHDLFNLTQRLKVLLEVCFLHELGLADGTVQDMIVRSRAYQYILRMVDQAPG